MMGNYYLLNSSDRWAAVCISKNGCTSLKACVLAKQGIHLTKKLEIHCTVGYSSASPFLRKVSLGKPDGFFTFAVWRNPVDRFLSAYKHYAIEGNEGRLSSLSGNIGDWMDYAEFELSKPVLEQDEHLRRQCDYYELPQVDEVVGIDRLVPWFALHGWGPLQVLNKSQTGAASLTEKELARIKFLYRKDWELHPGSRS